MQRIHLAILALSALLTTTLEPDFGWLRASRTIVSARANRS